MDRLPATRRTRRPVFADRDLAAALFVPGERWGWERTEPQPPQPSPLLETPPQRRFPRMSSGSANPEAEWGVIGAAVGVALLITLVLAVVLGPAGLAIGGGVALLVGLALGAYILLRAREAKEAAQTRRGYELAYRKAHMEWQTEIKAHDQREQERVDNSKIWNEQKVQSASRVDVFGGTPDSWTNLLATVGASVLSNGAGMLVLDMCEHPVAADLAKLADVQGVDVATLQLPGATGQLNLLAGLVPADIAELIAEAAHGARSTTVAGDAPMKSTDMRSVSTEILEAIASRLMEPITFARLGAALRLLRRLYSPGREALLSASEVRELSELVDNLASSNQAGDELQYLSSLMGLASENGPGDEPVQLWPAKGLAVVMTESPNPRRKDALDRLVVGRVLHELRVGNARKGDMIVVTGADHLGLPTLETLAKQARRRGVRLVLMLEHLRDENAKLLGGSDSAAVIMRLGNSQEATAAADFIGRDYTFVLSQITDSIGKTYTYNTSESEGESETPGQAGPSVSWNDSVSESWADSDTKGSTLARVYEYTVEPTTIQTLPITAFLLVDTGPDGRRITACDCYPGITLLGNDGKEKTRMRLPRTPVRGNGINSVRGALQAAKTRSPRAPAKPRKP